MYATHSHLITVLWSIWAGVMAGFFFVLEFLMLGTGRPQDTLSANVWRMEEFLPGQAIMHWSAIHFLFIGVFILLNLWLLGHFGFGWWR